MASNRPDAEVALNHLMSGGVVAYQRALAYDYTMVLGVVTFAAVLVVLGNLVADLLYAAVDPRIRLA